MLTPRQRVELALRGYHGATVPFTMYSNHCHRGTTERLLRNRGMCLVERLPVIACQRPNVKEWSRTYVENGVTYMRATYETPVGTVTQLIRPVPGTSWRLEYLFKTPDDFKTLLFLIEDERYAPDYEAFAQAERRFGDDAIFRGILPAEPLQFLISGSFFGTERFCMEWMDRRDEMLKLYEARARKDREQYELAARSPALHFNMGGNVVPEIVGLETFEKYYAPHYNEAAEILHRHGKLIGCHFDANCRIFAKAIAGTALDYIEAFTPAPDTDMTLGEACRAWPNKAIWINYSSSMHLRPDSEVLRFAVDLLNQADSVDGLIMGITENIPLDRWQASCTAIMDGLDRHASENRRPYE